MVHRLLFWLGLCLAFPVGVLLAQSLSLELSWSGRVYALGLAILVAGLLTLPLRTRRGQRWPVTRLAFALLCATFVLRATTANGDGPTQDPPRLLPARSWPPTWLLEERDLVLAGARMVRSSGRLPRAETRRLEGALAEAYDELQQTKGPKPRRIVISEPAAGGRSWPALLVEPVDTQPRTGLVFLHGYAGNFAWPCWQVARAALEVGALTLCPSVGFDGAWWRGRGEQIVRGALQELRQRGVERIYLAGLSNGAAGVASLAPRLNHELAGLILISGARRGGGTAGLPVLVLQGDRDSMMPTRSVRRFAEAQGPHTVYRELPGSHFVLLHRREEARLTMAAWLTARERDTPPKITPPR